MTPTAVARAKATPDLFTATRSDSAEDKARAATAIVALIRSDFARTKFTRRVYKALYLHMFGHIAHFDRDGFYATWFARTGDRVLFLENALGPGVSDPEKGVSLALGPVGDPTHCWSDVERWLADWIIQSGALTTARQRHDQAVEDAERAELARLTEKYGTTPAVEGALW